jgi:DNA-binding beta-propeller fold protein YncE
MVTEREVRVGASIPRARPWIVLLIALTAGLSASGESARLPAPPGAGPQPITATPPHAAPAPPRTIDRPPAGVVSTPGIVVTVETSVESSIDFTSPGAVSHHHLVLEQPLYPDVGSIELVADGRFGTQYESAQADIEGLFGVDVGSSGVECAPAEQSIPLSTTSLAGLAADGSVDVTVKNAPAVQPNCPLNRHTTRLRYTTLATHLDFGEVRTGAARSLAITIRNMSAATRTVQIGCDSPSFVPPALFVVLGPFSAVQEPVSFAPAALGSLTGRLFLKGNLVGDVPWLIDLAGVGVPPPNLLVNPDALSATLPAGGTLDESLMISNLGDRPLDFTLSVEAPGPHVAHRIVVLDDHPISLVTIDLDSGARQRTPLDSALSGAIAVALDPSGKRAYLATYADGLFFVDLPAGTPRLVAQAARGVIDLALSRDGSTAFLVNQLTGDLVAVDLPHGATRIVTHGLGTPVAVAASSTNDKIFVARSEALLQVDIATGLATPLSGAVHGATGLWIDERHQAAYVSSATTGLVRVGLRSGAVVPIVSATYGGFNGFALVDGHRSGLLFATSKGRVDQIDVATGKTAAYLSGLNSPRDFAVQSELTDPPDFLSVSPTEGTLPISGAQQFAARFAASQLPAGTYAASIVVRESGFVSPIDVIPASLTVVSSPHLVITGAEQSVERTGPTYDSCCENVVSTMVLPLPQRPEGPGILEITGEASLAFGVGISVEGRPIGALPQVVCYRTQASFELPQDLMTDIASDGSVELEFEFPRTDDFHYGCGTDRITARLNYPGSADTFDFGTVETGQVKALDIVVSNSGNETLALSSIKASGDSYSTTQTDLALMPGQSSKLNVTLAAGEPGPVNGVLEFDTNEPGRPSVLIPLVATVVDPPMVSVSPVSVSAVVTEGSTTPKNLSVANGGGLPLDFSLRLTGRPAGGGQDARCQPQALVTSRLISIDLATGERQQLHGPASGLSGYGITLDAAGATAFIANNTGPGVLEVDLATGTMKTIAGMRSVTSVALSRDERTLYAVGDGLFRVDLRTLDFDKIADFNGGGGITLDSKGSSLLVGLGDRIVAINPETGAMSTVVDGLVAPFGIALDANGSGAYVVEMWRDGSLGGSVVHADFSTGAVTPVLAGLDGAEDLAFDRSRGVLYSGEDAPGRIDTTDVMTGQTTVWAEQLNTYGFTLRPSLECSGRYVRAVNPFGGVPPLSAGDAPLTIDATELAPGHYETSLEILSNDPVNPVVTVPVVVEVLADRDKDGVADASDNCPDLANADQADRDGDRRGDLCDNCPAAANSDQMDGNADGSGDACQPRADLLAIRQDGGQFLEVRAHVTDPQNDTLTGTVTIDPEAGGSGPAAHRSPAPTGATGLIVPFVGRLPRTIVLDALSPGTTYRLTITATDGNTKPVAVAGDFLFQGEADLAFDDPPVAAFAAFPPALECNRPGGAAVTLSGAPSQDPDSSPGTRDDIRSFAWILDAGLPAEMDLGAGESLAAFIPLGSHTIALRVADSIGEMDVASAAIAVVDTTPPVASLTADPAILFPPNHEMRQARLVWQVADACDPAPAATLVSVSSSEPDDAAGDGDGHTTGDIRTLPPGPAPTTIGVRAERAASGGGRVYEIRAQVSDASGNATPVSTSVVVPHDKGQGPEPLILRLDRAPGGAGAASGVRITWTGIAEADSYDLISGDLASWHPEGEVLGLGEVRVLARATTLTSVTEGAASPSPAAGHAWFYLVQERIDGLGAGFGTVTAPWPRRPDSCSGGCP